MHQANVDVQVARLLELENALEAYRVDVARQFRAGGGKLVIPGRGVGIGVVVDAIAALFVRAGDAVGREDGIGDEKVLVDFVLPVVDELAGDVFAGQVEVADAQLVGMLRAFGAAHLEPRRRAGQGCPTQFGLEGIGDGLFACVGRFARIGGENRAVPRAVAQGEFDTGGVAVVFAAAFVYGRFGFE